MRPYAGRNPQHPLDRAVAERASQQHGVVAGRQLAELGLSASGTRNRVASGRLHRVHRGVFAVGHAGLTQKGRFMAAVLACGPGAVAS
jgi:predicted transcriptional regulator of viral defense system